MLSISIFIQDLLRIDYANKVTYFLSAVTLEQISSESSHANITLLLMNLYITSESKTSKQESDIGIFNFIKS